MSWQRILETARKQGMPVIVTDVAGREPLVILPFDSYEGLLEGRGPARVGPRPSSIRPLKDEVVMEEVAEFTAQDLQKKVDVALDQLIQLPPEEPGELSLEERFYLEPVDEEPNNP